MQPTTLLANAREIFESDDPAEMLKSLGITHDHSIHEKIVRRDGQEVRRIIIHTYEWTFPNMIPFEASFCKEGLVKKVIKLFSREPEVGDPLFDDNVFMSTSDEDACMRTLSDRFQGSILNFVQQNGTVEFGGMTATTKIQDTAGASGYSTDNLEEQYVIAAHLAQWM